MLITYCIDFITSRSHCGRMCFRTDPKLFRDDVDIKFSRSLNSCKVPQVGDNDVVQLRCNGFSRNAKLIKHLK